MKVVSLLRKYRYEIIAATCGAVVMIFELVGARMIAPFFGTSLYVWTAVIGVILGALAFGYWFGGRLVDRSASHEGLMKIITLAALCIVVTMLLQETLLAILAGAIQSVRLSALIAALLLFAPASLLLGVVSPYLVRLRLSSLATAGAAVGRLSAAGTFGSIIGTFAAGYWLISWLGNRQLGLILVIALLALSFLAYRKKWIFLRAATAVVGMLAFAGVTPLNSEVIADIDSPYSRYLVTESSDEIAIRELRMDPFGIQSAQYIGNPDVLLFDYTNRFMDVVKATNPERTLVIGGGTFTFPLAVARAYPEREVTAVEIDPKLTEIATTYFSLTPRDNLKIINEDGRVFLNRPDSSAPYHAIFMDAFSSLTPPYQLTTTEAVGRTKAMLDRDGVVAVNIIATAENSPYLSAVIATYRQHFSHVDTYQLSSGIDKKESQNLLVVATNNKNRAGGVKKTLSLPEVFVRSSSVLRDDFAPVEQLIEQQ